jgi:ubiquinone biosynthesis protein
MNTLQFIFLIKDIYGKNLPDLKKIEKKGLLAIKIAQHFALRIDFLDEKVCTHLSQLYRNNPIIIPEENLIPLLNEYSNTNLEKNLLNIEKTPFASASIGQVHKATLINGEEVIIKILKKDFFNSFENDVHTVKRFFKLIINIYPKLSKVFDPIGILENIEEYTFNELDFYNEIEGQVLLKNIYEKNKNDYDLSKLKFHKIYSEFSSKKILVSKKINGKTFDELLNEKKLKYSTLLDFFYIHGFYLFGPGIFHGDIHPGNIILDENENIYFVDTSAISKVGDKIKIGLFNFFKGLSLYDFESCAYHLNKMAEKEINGNSFENFKIKFLKLYEGFENSTVSQVSLTKKMMETIKLGVSFGMIFEKGMFGIIKSLMYLDGMVLRCNPHAILLKDMRKFIDEFEKLKVAYQF